MDQPATVEVLLEGQGKRTPRLRGTDCGKLKVLTWTRPSPTEYRLGREAPAASWPHGGIHARLQGSV